MIAPFSCHLIFLKISQFADIGESRMVNPTTRLLSQWQLTSGSNNLMAVKYTVIPASRKDGSLYARATSGKGSGGGNVRNLDK